VAGSAGVVFSAYQTLNHVAAVRHRFRAGFVSRYVRVFALLAMLLAGALATGALTVVATALPGQPAVQRAASVLGSALVVFTVAAALAPSCCWRGLRRSGRCGREPSWARRR